MQSIAPTSPLSQGGTVVNADRQFKADVLIRDGLILRVGPDLQARPRAGGGRCFVPSRLTHTCSFELMVV